MNGAKRLTLEQYRRRLWRDGQIALRLNPELMRDNVCPKVLPVLSEAAAIAYSLTRSGCVGASDDTRSRGTALRLWGGGDNDSLSRLQMEYASQETEAEDDWNRQRPDETSLDHLLRTVFDQPPGVGSTSARPDAQNVAASGDAHRPSSGGVQGARSQAAASGSRVVVDLITDDESGSEDNARATATAAVGGAVSGTHKDNVIELSDDECTASPARVTPATTARHLTPATARKKKGGAASGDESTVSPACVTPVTTARHATPATARKKGGAASGASGAVVRHSRNVLSSDDDDDSQLPSNALNAKTADEMRQIISVTPDVLRPVEKDIVKGLDADQIKAVRCSAYGVNVAVIASPGHGKSHTMGKSCTALVAMHDAVRNAAKRPRLQDDCRPVVGVGPTHTARRVQQNQLSKHDLGTSVKSHPAGFGVRLGES